MQVILVLKCCVFCVLSDDILNVPIGSFHAKSRNFFLKFQPLLDFSEKMAKIL